MQQGVKLLAMSIDFAAQPNRNVVNAVVLIMKLKHAL